MMRQFKIDVDYTLENTTGQSEQVITSALISTIYYFEVAVYQSTALTNADKEAIGSAVNTLYASVGTIVRNHIYPETPIDQTRVQWSWNRFRNIVGSILLTMAVVAAAAVVIATIVGSAPALLPATASILGWTVQFEAVAAMYGAAAGFALSSALAVGNTCLVNTGPTVNLQFTTCDN